MATMADAKELTELLEKILKVVSLQVGEDKSMTERARLLKMAGLDNETIASVLNTTRETVATLTTGLTKKRGKARKTARKQARSARKRK